MDMLTRSIYILHATWRWSYTTSGSRHHRLCGAPKGKSTEKNKKEKKETEAEAEAEAEGGGEKIRREFRENKCRVATQYLVDGVETP